jgi:hypothetical protein
MSANTLDTYYNDLSAQQENIELSVKAISNVLTCDVVDILSIDINPTDTLCTLTCNIENNLSIDENRIIANIYEKKSDTDTYSIIHNADVNCTSNNISENTITIPVNFNITNKENCILVVTIFKKPNITNDNLITNT